MGFPPAVSFSFSRDITTTMRSLLAAAAAAAVLASARADDPADSWLVYAAANSTGRILHANATWAVPAFPTTRAGGNAPGW
jgi:hypothetical protein